jgi:uncharacterized protein (TIGR02271 family)
MDMFNNQARIPDGATVYDLTGEKVGTVLENNQQDGYLVVEKGWLFPKDFYVPTAQIESVEPDAVYLRIGKDDLSGAQYDQPPTTQGQTIDSSSASTTAAAFDQGDIGEAGDVRVPVREEELIVDKQTVEAGRAHIHKNVVTEQKTVNVPVQHERVTVERVALSDDALPGDAAFEEQDFEVPVMGEKAVVGKRVSGVEEVIIHKDVVTEQEQVTDSVRKERVTVDGADLTDQPGRDNRF